MQNIQLSQASYFIPVVIIVGILYALVLYYRERKLKESAAWLPVALGTLRFMSIVLILFLLLGPLLKLISTENELPIVVVLEDNSYSIEASTDGQKLEQLRSSMGKLKSRLNQEYIVDSLKFGAKVNSNDIDSIDRLSSNISAALESVSESYEDQNLGAVILISDGIYNEGKNPLYADINMNAPLFAVAVGDTTQKRDLLIKNVLHNRIVYLNDRFTIESDLQAYNAKGAKTELRLFQIQAGNRVLKESKSLNIDSDRYFESFSFSLDANQVGNNKYVLELAPINNEISNSNNLRNIYIDVLDARQKVLLFAKSSHPDIKMIKKVIEKNKNYEVDVAYADKALRNPSGYDIVILHNLPSADFQIEEYLNLWEREKIPEFFIMGHGVDRDKFNSVQNVMSLSGETFSLNNVTPVLNSQFTTFTSSEKLKNKLQSFVPLKAPFGEFSPTASAQVYMYQKIGSVETQYPLLAYSDINNHKQAVLAGEGIWRWALMEYFETETQEISSEILQKTIQYISQKEDKRQFRAFSNKKDYRENERILFDAQLYNDNFELINNPDAKLTIRNEDNEEFDFIFSKNENYYIIDAGRFPEGNYRFSASTEYNGKKLNANGRFSVQSIVKESYDLTARHDILYQISQKFGGEMVQPEQIDSLYSMIQQDQRVKTVMYQKSSSKPLLDWPKYLLAILILLGLEWFIRRYYGAY